MSSARDEILARVRAAKGTPGPSSRPVARDYRHADERPHDELVELFRERVDDYSAEVQRVDSDHLRDAITAAAARHHGRRFVVPSGLPDAWRPAELELIDDSGLSAHDLDQLHGAITGCTVAIAETGTIALTAGGREGRRILSLVPDLHICIVGTHQIVGTVPEAITRLGEITRSEARPITLISGPSATSDIELQRVEGVHGPRRLVVLVLEGDACG
ncbi:MAG: lactate utilization protein C [Acidobacteriota bacterium]|nr:lactate utilization protein C [Acidobacteriota bacterium]